ncbi:MAG: hypothetical protein H6679_02240 [Epsilonproteobacteria bacterium]|nr:hypothetical protein [Campylobacterota bacterium]
MFYQTYTTVGSLLSGVILASIYAQLFLRATLRLLPTNESHTSKTQARTSFFSFITRSIFVLGACILLFLRWKINITLFFIAFMCSFWLHVLLFKPGSNL